MDYDTNQQLNLQKNITLTESSIIPMRLLGEHISPNSNILIPLNSSIPQILWTMICSFHPSHLVFESNSSKLFICTHQGYISVYNYTTSNLLLIGTFYLQYTEKLQSIVIKS